MVPTPNAESGRIGRAWLRSVAAGPALVADLHRDVEALIPSLRRYARALKRDAVAADDLVQESLCKALAKLHLWERGTDLRAWLFTILHHQHHDDLRRAVRWGVGDPVDELTNLPAPGADAIVRLQLRDLEHAIARLPAPQRQALLLIGLEGLSYSEVAEVVGVPLGTVRSRFARARATLRRVMDPKRPVRRSPAGFTPRSAPGRSQRVMAA
jgi:RNA polymerase sigma-70 factor, ECF subfamily